MSFKCYLCDKVFKFIKLKIDHVKTDHKDDRICKFCELKCQTGALLETHVKSHFQDCTFLCEFCAKVFRKKNLLRQHMAMHRAQKFLCDLCGYTTRHKGDLIRHLRAVHQKLRRFECDKCPAPRPKYSTRPSLNMHLYNHHDAPAPIRCPDCHAGFTFQAELRAHKRYRRSRCGPNRIGLNRKIKMHCEHLEVSRETGEHICKLCNKSFKNRDLFIKHDLNKHRDSRVRSKCEECDVVFSDPPTMKRHNKAVHLKLKPHM